MNATVETYLNRLNGLIECNDVVKKNTKQFNNNCVQIDKLFEVLKQHVNIEDESESDDDDEEESEVDEEEMEDVKEEEFHVPQTEHVNDKIAVGIIFGEVVELNLPLESLSANIQKTAKYWSSKKICKKIFELEVRYLKQRAKIANRQLKEKKLELDNINGDLALRQILTSLESKFFQGFSYEAWNKGNFEKAWTAIDKPNDASLQFSTNDKLLFEEKYKPFKKGGVSLENLAKCSASWKQNGNNCAHVAGWDPEEVEDAAKCVVGSDIGLLTLLIRVISIHYPETEDYGKYENIRHRDRVNDVT